MTIDGQGHILLVRISSFGGAKYSSFLHFFIRSKLWPSIGGSRNDNVKWDKYEAHKVTRP